MNRNVIEEPDTNSRHCGHLSFDKAAQNIHRRKDW
jgi:hypothetical protein